MRLDEKATQVPGPNGDVLTVSPGGLWRLPYRGSRYSFRQVDGVIRQCWSNQGTVLPCLQDPTGLHDAFRRVRAEDRGSFRVTAHGEVLTRRMVNRATQTEWETFYLGRMEVDANGILAFEHFEINPPKLEVGRLWPGFHFRHGEGWSVGVDHGRRRNYLRWRLLGESFWSREAYEELCARYREIRPTGGRVHFTEFGHVWMNVNPTQVSDQWRERIMSQLRAEQATLSRNDVLLRSVMERTQRTQCWPLYLGKIEDFDAGRPPRTRFTELDEFGIGAEETPA